MLFFNQKNLKLFTVAILLSSASSVAHAGPGKIAGPHVEKGELEVELTGTYAFDYDDAGDAFENEFELEYGLTDRILLETEIEFADEAGDDLETEGFGFGVRYEVAEPGKLLIDTAIEVGYEFSGTGDADSAGVGFLFEKEIGAYEFVSNVDFEHEVGSGSNSGLGLELALGGYTELGNYDVGIEYFGDIGNLTEQGGYNAQEHFIGPVIGTEFHISEHTELEFKLGYFQGISDAADDGTIKYELGLEF